MREYERIRKRKNEKEKPARARDCMKRALPITFDLHMSHLSLYEDLRSMGQFLIFSREMTWRNAESLHYGNLQQYILLLYYLLCF
jgi:hypothetical protein